MAIATGVTERPFPMTAHEVIAVFAGKRTQVRRVVKSPISPAKVAGKRGGRMLYDLSRAWADPGFPTDDNGDPLPMARWPGGLDPAPESAYRCHYLHVPVAHPEDGWDAEPGCDRRERVRCPFGVPGDRLWVRETFARRLDVDPHEEPDKARHYALYRVDGTSLDEPHWHSYPDRWTPSIHMPRWASRITLELTAVRVERLTSISSEDAVAEGFSGYGDFLDGFYRINAGRITYADDPWVWALAFRRIAAEGSR